MGPFQNGNSGQHLETLCLPTDSGDVGACWTPHKNQQSSSNRQLQHLAPFELPYFTWLGCFWAPHTQLYQTWQTPVKFMWNVLQDSNLSCLRSLAINHFPPDLYLTRQWHLFKWHILAHTFPHLTGAHFWCIQSSCPSTPCLVPGWAHIIQARCWHTWTVCLFRVNSLTVHGGKNHGGGNLKLSDLWGLTVTEVKL